MMSSTRGSCVTSEPSPVAATFLMAAIRLSESRCASLMLRRPSSAICSAAPALDGSRKYYRICKNFFRLGLHRVYGGVYGWRVKLSRDAQLLSGTQDLYSRQCYDD